MEEPLDSSRDSRRQQAPVRLMCQDTSQDIGDLVRFEHPPAGQQLVQHATKSPDVRPLAGDLAARLLRTHVGRGPEHHPQAGQQRRAGDRRRIWNVP